MTSRSFSWEGRCYDGTFNKPMLNFYLTSDPRDDMSRVVNGIKRLSWTAEFSSEYFENNEEFSSVTLIVPQNHKDDVIDLLTAMKFVEH